MITSPHLSVCHCPLFLLSSPAFRSVCLDSKLPVGGPWSSRSRPVCSHSESKVSTTLDPRTGSFLSPSEHLPWRVTDGCGWGSQSQFVNIGAPVGGTSTLPTTDCPVWFQMLLLEIFTEHIFLFYWLVRVIGFLQN